MSDDPKSLRTWLDELASALGVDYAMDEDSLHILLDLARDAAHNVVRPSAPLTTFLVGLAVGRGQSLGAAAATATRLALVNDDEVESE